MLIKVVIFYYKLNNCIELFLVGGVKFLSSREGKSVIYNRHLNKFAIPYLGDEGFSR